MLACGAAADADCAEPLSASGGGDCADEDVVTSVTDVHASVTEMMKTARRTAT